MNNIKVVVQKELARVFGDKKLVFSLFILPAILMIGIYSFMGSAVSKMMNDIEEHIPTIYIQNAPDGFLESVKNSEFQGNIIYATNNTFQVVENGTEITKTIEDIKDGILNGEIELMISFEDGFYDKVKSYTQGMKNPEIKTYYNPSEDYSTKARGTFLEQVVTPYQQILLTERIGDLNSLSVFDIDIDPTTSMIQNEEKASGKMLAMMLPYLIIMLLFTGPMSLGVDAITGEKERGTMASMLITPMKRGELVMGKLVSLSILSMLSAIVYAASMVFAVPKMFNGISGEGSAVSFSLIQIFELFIIMISLVFLYVAIVSLISVFAKTIKEASAYISPVYIIIIIAGVLTMFAGNQETPLAMFGIPVYGGAVAIQKIMTNELTLIQFGVNIGGTLVVAFLLTVLITKAFNSEKVMFNA